MLQRQLQAEGLSCQVIAPSLIPAKPGERVKTDRRDARKLAELLLAGLLTEVHPPSASEAAVRDLCRCREGIKQDLTRCRHRLGKLLLRRGLHYVDGRAWTQRHRRLAHPQFVDRWQVSGTWAGSRMICGAGSVVAVQGDEVGLVGLRTDRRGWR
ncbi:MAG: IS110 family transposase [Thermoanaerobaculia bacterium]